MNEPKYKVGTEFVWIWGAAADLIGTVTTVDLERDMYVYTIYDLITKETKNHGGFDIKVMEEITRPLTKLDRALR